MNNTNIVLIGPMGSGKSTVGKKLANTIDKTFVDSDKEIEQTTGATISLIFELEGEAGFRKRETQMLQQLCERNDIVLATGGGIVLQEENRGILRHCGYVVYLQASIDLILERTRRDTSRPLLQTENPREKLQEIMRKRAPLYESLADLTINTDNRTVNEVAREIAQTTGGNQHP